MILNDVQREEQLEELGLGGRFLSLVLTDGTDLLSEHLPPHILPLEPAPSADLLSELKALTSGCFKWLDENDPACSKCALALHCARARHLHLCKRAEHLFRDEDPVGDEAEPSSGPSWEDPELQPSGLSVRDWSRLSESLLRLEMHSSAA
jgi:hypothetical protein